MAPDRIEIHGLELNCIVGVRPHEREIDQPVRLDLQLELELAWAGRTGRISSTCDYDAVATEVAALLRFRRYRLLESAAEETAAMLLGLHPALKRVTLRLEKPHALAGRARAAAVRIARTPEDFPRRREQTPFGEAEVLLETREAGLYLLHVAAGRSIVPHHHRVMRELEWLVAGTLLQHGRPVALRQPVAWTQGQVHNYENPSAEPATLFCCDCPPFIPADEIAVEEASS